MDGLAATRPATAAARPLDTAVLRCAAALGAAGLLGIVPAASLLWLCLNQPMTVAQRINEGHGGILGLLVWAMRTMVGELIRYL